MAGSSGESAGRVQKPRQDLQAANLAGGARHPQNAPSSGSSMSSRQKNPTASI